MAAENQSSRSARANEIATTPALDCTAKERKAYKARKCADWGRPMGESKAPASSHIDFSSSGDRGELGLK